MEGPYQLLKQDPNNVIIKRRELHEPAKVDSVAHTPHFTRAPAKPLESALAKLRLNQESERNILDVP